MPTEVPDSFGYPIRVDGAAGVALNNKLVGESHHLTHTIQPSSAENLKTTISQGQIGSGRDTGSGALKSETVSKKAFALQDKVIFVLNSLFTPNN